MRYWCLIADELRHHKMRAALMISAATVAFLALGVLGTLRYSLDSGDGSAAGRRLIVTSRSGLMQPLPLSLRAQIRKIPGVALLGHATWQGAYYQNRKQMPMVLAVDPGPWLQQHPGMQVSAHQAADFVQRRDGMLVSKGLARRFGWRIGDVVPLKSILYSPPAGDPAWEYTVVGIFDSGVSGGARNYAVTQYDFLNQARRVWRNTVGTFIVTPDDATAPGVLAQRIDDRFATTDTPTSTSTDRAFHEAFFAQFGDVVRSIDAIIGIGLCSLLLLVGSGSTIWIRHRTRDIGVLRLLGYTSRDILVVSGGLVGTIVLAGAGLGLGLSAIFNRLVTGRFPQLLPDIVLPWTVLWQSSVIVAGLWLLSAAVPTWVALEIDPLTALGEEAA